VNGKAGNDKLTGARRAHIEGDEHISRGGSCNQLRCQAATAIMQKLSNLTALSRMAL